MAEVTKPLRADAERNRRLLLDAAAEAFAEHGLDVGVGEIARRAGVGHGTVFRRFPTKEHLIAAVVVDRMHQASGLGRELLADPDPGGALFKLLAAMVQAAQTDRALFEAVADTFLANEDIRAAHSDLVGVIDELLRRAQKAGAVRDDVGALDLLMMFKGVCEASRPFNDADIAARQLELVRAALRPVAAADRLQGQPPTLDDMERAFPRAG
ncbi:MAG TPA: TetR family transcriptional regulator [Solirubrobacteraceae bacterium]